MTQNTLAAVDYDGVPDPMDALRSLVGTSYRTGDYYEVGREKVREFAEAIHNTHPAHWIESSAAALGHEHDGRGTLVAPITFPITLCVIAQRRLVEILSEVVDMSSMVHTDQTAVSHKPVVVGDRLVVDVSLEAVKTVLGRPVLVTKFVLSNQRNELLQTLQATLLVGSPDDVDIHVVRAYENLTRRKLAAPRLPERAIPSDLPRPTARLSSSDVQFDDVAVGDMLPPHVARLTRGDLVNYAGVAGDDNPIHWNDDFAARVVSGDVLAHGVLTMGIGEGYVAAWLGDPAAILDYSVRFTSAVNVHPDDGAAVHFTGKIKSLDADRRTAVIALCATFGGKRILGHSATLTVQLR